MKKGLIMPMAAFCATALTFLASTVSASACVWGFYQPEEPKLLKDK